MTDWISAGQEIDALAEMLNVEGDQIVRVVADGTAREGANADQSAAAHAAYRTAVTELVEAARKAREHGQVTGGSRRGGDKR